MFCGKCGAKIEGNEKFCPVCGNALSDSASQKRKSSRAGKKKAWIGLLLIFVLALAGVGGFILLKGNWGQSEYIALAANEEGLYGYINTKGEPVIDYQYDLAFDFSPDGLALVADKTDESVKDLSDLSYPEDYEGLHFYVIDAQGKKVFDLAEYDMVDIGGFQTSSLLAVADKIGVDDDDQAIYRWGFVNEKGEEVFECQFDELSETGDGYGTGMFWSNGWLAVEKNNQQGIIDETGNYVVPLGEQDFLGVPMAGYIGYPQGLIGVERDGRVGFVDENNKTVIPFEYTDASYFEENGIAWVEKEVGVDQDGEPLSLWGAIDRENNVAIPFEYSGMGYFRENQLASVEKKVRIDEDGDPVYRCGCIDKEGRIVIPFEYEQITAFSDEGLAVACKDGEWMVIDENGEEQAKVDYDFDSFAGMTGNAWGLMSIHDLHNSKIIDKEGEVFYPVGEAKGLDYIISISIEDKKKRRMLICKGKKGINGLTDERGNVILPFVYDKMQFCPIAQETWVWTVKYDSSGEVQKSAFYDLDGNVVLDLPDGYFCSYFVKVGKQ